MNLKTELLREIEKTLIWNGFLEKKELGFFRKVTAKHILKSLKIYEINSKC